MIWSDGKILPDVGLAINAADRTFEHGLGLFETLRTWGGRPTLLDKHRARMMKSAEELRIPINPARFPADEAVRALLLAEGSNEDRMLRITATGGSHAAGSVVWMRSKSLGKSPDRESIRVSLDSWTTRHDDPLARHKSLNFWARRIAVESARSRGFDETLGLSDDGDYCEGGWSNLFVILHDRLLTPSLAAPIIPGVMRRLVLDLAEGLPLAALEVPGISADQLGEADEVFLTNSVRGIIPVALAEGSGRRHDWPAPGPWTRRLQAALARGVTVP
jgi:branched-subunit amino acid aminotransferase/4-amino-4-deoxychorismate lyase